MGRRSFRSPQTADSEKFHGNPSKKPDPLPLAVSSGIITEKDAELIKSYIYEHSTSANISQIAILQLIRLLITMRRWSGQYNCVTITDLYEIVDGVKTDNSRHGNHFRSRPNGSTSQEERHFSHGYQKMK